MANITALSMSMQRLPLSMISGQQLVLQISTTGECETRHAPLVVDYEGREILKYKMLLQLLSEKDAPKEE
jgi:hypothetical protein